MHCPGDAVESADDLGLQGEREVLLRLAAPSGKLRCGSLLLIFAVALPLLACRTFRLISPPRRDIAPAPAVWFGWMGTRWRR